MHKVGGVLAGALLVIGGVACSSELPPPQTRSVIIYSGERILPTSERMGEVETWLRPVLENIEMDPSFLIRTIEEDTARYPWDALDLITDTADIRVADAALDAETPYMIYAFLRLMQERGTLEEWMPEAAGLSGFELEEAIVSRVSDVWLLGRSVFDTQPFGPVDEILYSKEFGYLEEFLLATQGARFPEAVEAHRLRSPERTVQFREWLLRTFERDGPGFVPPGEAAPPANATGPGASTGWDTSTALPLVTPLRLRGASGPSGGRRADRRRPAPRADRSVRLTECACPRASHQTGETRLP